MIDEPPELQGRLVAAAVQREWGVDVTHAEHAAVGAGAWHWVVGDDLGPQWFATVDPVPTAEERRERLDAYDAAYQLAHHLPFVAAPVHTRDARIAVDVAPGKLLTVAPYLEGTSGSGPFADDTERAEVAALLGDLHSFVRPRHLPVWRPRVGWRARSHRGDLESCLASDAWAGGPYSLPACRLVGDARPVLRACLKRFTLLGAAVNGSISRWVVTHGEPHTAHVVRTPDGPRLVDWETLALAPRERDLREVLGASEGEDPWYAYVEAGGRPEPLSPDTVELFALQWHLSVVTDHAVRFSRPHRGTADDQRCFAELEDGLASLVEGWSDLG
jgi:spectinomycin phosphotransferase